MDCHCGGFLVEVMAPFVDKGWGWLNGARQYDNCWCNWMVAELGGNEIELWNCGFNVAEWLNDDFIFLYIKPLFLEKAVNIFLHHFHMLFCFLDKAFNHSHETRNLLLKSTKT